MMPDFRDVPPSLDSDAPPSYEPADSPANEFVEPPPKASCPLSIVDPFLAEPSLTVPTPSDLDEAAATLVEAGDDECPHLVVPVGYTLEQAAHWAISDPRRRYRAIKIESLRFNCLSREPELDGKPLTAEIITKLVPKFHDSVKVKVKGKTGLEHAACKVGKELLGDQIVASSHDDEYSPIQEYLRALPPWDGESRLLRFCKCVLKIQAPKRIEMVMVRKWFVAAVARAFAPGCQVDNALIFGGEQGAFKSSLFRTLFDPWHTDFQVPAGKIGDKDTIMNTLRCWCWEWGELDVIKGAARREQLKGYITIKTDMFRAPYARAPALHPRAFIFCGSTNEKKFLADDTGERRFWPIWTKALRVDLELCKQWREQIWAEALHYFNLGQRNPEGRWWLNPEEEKELKEHHLSFKVEPDIWLAPIEDYLDDCVTQGSLVTLEGVFRDALKLTLPGSQTSSDGFRVRKIMRLLGWEPGKVTRIQKENRTVRPWYRGSLPEES